MKNSERVCILGAGGSGLAAARLLAARTECGGRVCSDAKPSDAILNAFAASGFLWDAEGPKDERVVVSPGFAVEHSWMRRAAEAGLEVEAEAELGASALKGNILAVTGSLGKTTMAMLAAEILKAHGFSVTLSGNIGMPVSEVALNQAEADWHVIELSSFQTEIFRSFRPDIGIILNLAPNHLDRHGTMERYAEAKARMLAFQTGADVAVIPEDYPVPVHTRARVRTPDAARIPDTAGTGFDVPAYRANLAALMTGLAELDLDPLRVRAVLEAFQFPPHRMQILRHDPGGKIINDSKSTCLSATRAAMESLTGPMHVIIGGIHKGDSPEILSEVLKSGPVFLYLFGASAERFEAAWRKLAAGCEVHKGLASAVRSVFLHRKAGEPLLFSPGCASFDQYSSYMERGQHFQDLIEEFLTMPPDSKMPVQEIK
jgi:UDP-N-acetylmuramoylalanine--D-glutamate ligase